METILYGSQILPGCDDRLFFTQTLDVRHAAGIAQRNDLKQYYGSSTFVQQ